MVRRSSCSLVLVLACDAAYAMPLATTLRSIVESNFAHWPLVIHVLNDGFSSEQMRKVESSLPEGSAILNWKAISLESFNGFATLPHISRMTYARFLIPYVFGSQIKRALYIDADTLVLGDLLPLWSQDLAGAVVGAVEDDLAITLGAEGIPKVKKYFNAGVLLMDLDAWRKQRISERAMTYLSENPRTPFSDQDALNVVCDGLWRQLDARWNFQRHAEGRLLSMPCEEWPAIVHFVRKHKPWLASSLSLNASLYDGYRSRTLFARGLSQKLVDRATEARLTVKLAVRRWLAFAIG